MGKKLTTEQWYKRYPDLVKGQNILNSRQNAYFNCDIHGIYSHKLAVHSNRGCPECSKQRQSEWKSKKYKFTTEQWYDRYSDLVEGQILDKGNTYKAKFNCNIHGIYEQSLSAHAKQGCPKCGIESISIKECISDDEWYRRVPDLKKGQYNIRATKKFWFSCEKHGDYLQQVSVHMKGHGCPKCAAEKAHDRYVKTDYDWIDEVREDYRRMIKNGELNARNKVPFICNIHGEYWQAISSHSHGAGCPICGYERVSKKRNTTHLLQFDDITEESQVKLSNKELTIDDNATFICDIHGEYKQIIYEHLNGAGCKLCANEKNRIRRIKTDYDFLDEVREDYREKILNKEILCKDKIPFICNIHGEYWQALDSHQQGSGCPTCGLGKTPYNFYDWLKSIYKDTIIVNDRTQIKPQEIDFYLPDIKIGFEFNDIETHKNKYGDDKFGKPRQYHLNKSIKCWDKNIRLFHIWDFEWADDRIRPILESVIKHSLGMAEQKIYARKCEIKEISSKIGNEFFNEHHIQGPARSVGGGYWALYYNDEIVGCICSTVSKGIKTISRMAFKKNTLVVGGQSKLMKAVENTMNKGEALEYLVLNDYFGGNSFVATGWEKIKCCEMNKLYDKIKNRAYYASGMYYSKRKELLDSGKAYRFFTSGTTRYRKII